MIPHKSYQLDKGLWRKQHRVGMFHLARRRFKGNGKVRPVPGYREQGAILTAQNHPGLGLSPEDTSDASPLSTGGALLGHDRGLRTLKCNIGCCLFRG